MRDVFPHNGKYSYIEEVSREACRPMHVYGNFEISGTRVTGITPNQTIMEDHVAGQRTRILTELGRT